MGVNIEKSKEVNSINNSKSERSEVEESSSLGKLSSITNVITAKTKLIQESVFLAENHGKLC